MQLRRLKSSADCCGFVITLAAILAGLKCHVGQRLMIPRSCKGAVDGGTEVDVKGLVGR